MTNKLIFSTGGKNHYNPKSENELILLWQSEAKHGLFVLDYGLSHKAGLNHSQACKQLGQAILHNLCCEGIASNEGL